MKKACVLLAEGFEEVEALTPVDYLRRAGIEVTVLGLGGLKVAGAHGIVVSADAILEGSPVGIVYDAVIVPGGIPGSKHLAESRETRDLIERHFEAGRVVAAICAAPAIVLHEACGILAGRRFTGYPGTEVKVKGAFASSDRVVVDGNLITSRAAGTAGEFSIAVIAALAGEAMAGKIAESLLLKR